GRLVMCLRAVVLAGLASGLLGLVGGLAPGEGGGLALAGAGSPRRAGGAGARSRLGGRGGVAEGLGSRHTRRVAYPIIGEARAAAALPGGGAGISLSWTRSAITGRPRELQNPLGSPRALFALVNRRPAHPGAGGRPFILHHPTPEQAPGR